MHATAFKLASSVHVDLSDVTNPHIRQSLSSPGWNVVALWRLCKDYPTVSVPILHLSPLTCDPEMLDFTWHLYPGGLATLSELHATFRRGTISPTQLRHLVKCRTIRDMQKEFFARIYDPLRPVKNLKEVPWDQILEYEQEIVEILEKALALTEARVVLLMREAELEDKPEDSDASQGNGGRRLFDRCTSLCSACPETLFDHISSNEAALSSHQRS